MWNKDICVKAENLKLWQGSWSSCKVRTETQGSGKQIKRKLKPNKQRPENPNLKKNREVNWKINEVKARETKTKEAKTFLPESSKHYADNGTKCVYNIL